MQIDKYACIRGSHMVVSRMPAGITVNYYYYYYSHPEIITKTLAEGVETIEIRKVSRVGRKWLPVEAHTSSNA